MENIVKALANGLKNGSLTHGIEMYSLLVAMRGQPAENCLEIANLAKKTKSKSKKADLGSVVGIDLAGDESKFNNSLYINCFRYAKEKLGLNTTVHSGELGASEQRLENVKIAIEIMKVDRIGHGYAAAKDEEVMKMIREKNIHLEVCPGTALAEGSEDAITVFAKHNLSFGLNEDDPAQYFGGCDFGW
tara:strand:- start:58 stop:624 length:567 start_codon:yes stop_codon:yes gene_type:complete